MSNTIARRDVKQLPTNINVLGGIFHYLPSMWASKIRPPNPLYGILEVDLWVLSLLCLDQPTDTIQHQRQTIPSR